MHRSSYEIDHFSSYVLASQSWYRMFACLGSERAASTSWRVAGACAVLSVVTASPSFCFSCRSATDELCLAGAVLEEAVHADGLVLRAEQAGEQRRLQPQAVRQA